MRTAINTHELADIRDVQVDKNMPQSERVKEFAVQIKDMNHYE